MVGKRTANRQISEMIGRRGDLASLARLITDPGIRLVTVGGTGGIGKTRLAQELICTVDDDFADGAVFVDLVPIKDARNLPERIALMLDLAPPSSGSVNDAVIQHLQSRNMLLVLDNMEHLLEGTPFIQNLLANCPDVVLLVTSRQRLAIPGERVFDLSPLVLPGQQCLASLESIESSEAVQLFLRRAEAADRSFKLTNENALDVAAICRRLDGLPLAIELAASRVAEIPPHLILRKFVRILPFLERSTHDPDGRHRTMRNAIAWSFESLPNAEQALFARISVFQSGFTLEGARAVGMAALPDATQNGPDVILLGQLASLVSKHLLLRRDWSGDDPRYDMLQTMREFGLDHLAESGEERDARDAHAAHFTALAEHLQLQLIGAEPAAAIARYTVELDEFRTALTWLTTSRPPSGSSAIRLCNALFRFWHWGGHVREGLTRYGVAIAQVDKEDSTELATAHLNIGHFTSDDLSAAFESYQTGYAMFQRLGDMVSAAGLLSCLGMTSEKLGDLDAAESYLRESLKLFEELDSDQGIGHVSHLLGALAGTRGNYAQANNYLDRARSLADQQGDAINAIFSIVEMGRLHRIEGRFREAEQLLQWSLTRLDESGIEITKGFIHAELGMIAISSNNQTVALQEFRMAIQHAVDTSVETSLGLSITGIAELASLSGRHEEAVELLAAANRWICTSGYSPDASEKALIAATTKRAVREMGDEAFALAWEKGSLRSISDAAQLALSIEITPAAVALPIVPARIAGDRYNLTKQERKVLCRMAQGEKNQQIADALFISSRTVAVHVQNILRKLDAENRTHASALAYLAGICVLETGSNRDY